MAERGGEEEPRAHQEAPDNNNKRKLDEIQIAKQKAQEYIARLVNDAESKRPRVEESSEPSSVASFPKVASFPDVTQKPASQPTANPQVGLAPFAAQSGPYYGFQGTSKRISIPNGKVGVIIGKGGETIKYLQLQSGAKIQITKDTDADIYAQTRDVTLSGQPEQVSRAEQLINEVIAQTDAGGSGPSGGQRPTSIPPGTEQTTMKVPNDKVALMIGKGGETIKNMQSTSGARIQIVPLHLPPGDTSTERTVYINGTKEQIESAKELVNDVLSGNRPRNLNTQNSYTQQGYRPPGNWGQPPIQQPGYGYAQPGTYPTPPPYYSSYPPQASGWDQSNQAAVPPPQQQYPGYYYGQPAQTEIGSAQTDVSYSYGQPPPATNQTNDQGYSQQPQSYGQGSAQADVSYGYGQAPPATDHTNNQGYIQQPQSYGQGTASQVPQHDQQKPYTTTGYGPPAAPTQLDGTVPNQPYGSQSSTQPQPAYPVAYSQPPTVSPTEYGSSQSYGAPLASQPGYDQTGYPQYGGQQPPQLTPSATQPVYGHGSYPSQPPPAQSNYTPGTNPPHYGQQQPHPQPPAYTEP